MEGRARVPPRSKGTSGRKAPRRGGDAGQLAALEAAFVGMLLISSVTIVIALPDDKPSPTATRDPVEDIVGDLLQGLEDIPGTDRYASFLERAVSQAVQGNTTAFENLIDRTLPPGAECRLWIDNGHQRRLLAGPSERLARESVSKSVLWRPEWAYGFAVPSFDVISEQQPLQIQGYMVSQGSLVKEAGVPVHVTVESSSGTYERAAITSVQNGVPTVGLFLRNETGGDGLAYVESLLPNWITSTVHNVTSSGPPPTPASFQVPEYQDWLNVTVVMTGTLASYTLTFTSPLGTTYPLVVAALDVPVTLSIPGPKNGTWTYTGAGTLLGDPVLDPATTKLWANVTALDQRTEWTLVVREEGTGTLKDGSALNLTFPGGWTSIDLVNKTQPGWRNITARVSLDTVQHVVAELDGDLAGASRTLKFVGKRPTKGDALYVLQALVTGTATARASFVLAAPSGLVVSQNEIEHDPYLASPKPLGAGGAATWGVVLPHPTTNPLASETIWNVHLQSADGRALWKDAPTGVWPTTGWSREGDGHLRWNGTLTLAANKVAQFLVRATTTLNASEDEPRIQVPLAFTGTDFAGKAYDTRFTLTDQKRPHIYTYNVPPPRDVLGQEQAGYRTAWDSTPTQPGNETANVTEILRGLRASGAVRYATTAWGTVDGFAETTRGGLAKSHLGLGRLTARVGETVNVTVDFQGLFDDLEVASQGFSRNVSSWNVELQVFDPAQAFLPLKQMAPSYHGKWGANGSLAMDFPTLTQRAVARWTNDTAAKVDTVAKATIPLTVPAGAFYGPHAIVASANFILNDAANVRMAQSARLLSVLDVVPDGGQNASALYWATLECWLADW